MSWLDDSPVLYRFKRPDGTIVHLELPRKQDAPAQFMCADGVNAMYDGFESEEVKQTHIVEYEQNGRMAVRIKGKDGSLQHLSKSKLKYLKTGKIENVYSSDYRKHLEKTNQEQLLRTEHNKRRANVTQAKPEDMLKNMPDGEYVSDGTNVMPAPEGMKNE